MKCSCSVLGAVEAPRESDDESEEEGTEAEEQPALRPRGPAPEKARRSTGQQGVRGKQRRRSNRSGQASRA